MPDLGTVTGYGQMLYKGRDINAWSQMVLLKYELHLWFHSKRAEE